MTDLSFPYRKKTGDRGSILIYTLMVLTVLCLIGAIGIQTTWFEIKLSGNDRFINRLKIKAESTAASAVALVDKQQPDVLKDNAWDSPTRQPWLSRGMNDQYDMESGEDKRKNINAYIRDTANWNDDGDDPDNCAVLVPETDNEDGEHFSEQFNRCLFQVIDMEVAQGSSLQTGNRYSTMHNLYITGLSQENQGKCLVQIGYRKRY
jgi:hypothetical protein